MGEPLVLIVEDERDISLIFAKALRSAGFETEIVHSGDVAIEWLSLHDPDLIVLDLQMPEVGGMEVLEHIRADPRLADTYVIITTAYPHMAEGLHEMADWVFFKPVSFSQLRDMATRLATGMAEEGA